MKIVFNLFAALAICITAASQDPVTWTYSATRVSDKMVEVRLTATVKTGWHIYSQNQPEDAIAVPTTITLNKNPLLSPEGKVKEVGRLDKFKDKTLEIEAWQYAGKVAFVQQVKLKARARTNLSGNIEYQVCTGEKCLPPKTISFSVAIQ
jgi:thiol:disulfide interchange protein DsbD